MRNGQRTRRASSYDVAVVGSGAGGMTAALVAARRGHSVLLLEAAKQWGGMMNPFARHHFHFDVGLHYIGDAGPGQSLRRLFDELGLGDLRFRELDPDGFDRYVFPSARGVLCKGLDRWVERLEQQFPHERAALARFHRLMQGVLSLLDLGLAVGDGRAPATRDVMRILAQSPTLFRSTRMTLAALLDELFRDPHLKNQISGPVGDIGLPPSRVCAFMHLGLLADFLGGAFYPEGGTGAWRDAHVRELRRHGADLERNQRVTAIHVEGDGSFTLTTEAGDAFRAESVISNLDARDTMRLFDEAHGWAWARRRAERLVPGFGTLCVFLGLDLDLTRTELSSANVWHFGHDNLESTFDAAARGTVAHPPTYFLTSPTLKDPHGGHAPAGKHTLEIITIAGYRQFERWSELHTMKRGDEYERLKEQLADQLLASVEARYVPGLRQHIVVKEVATPVTTRWFVNAREGSIFGPEHTPEQVMLHRMPPWVGIPGLYLCGSSVLSAGVVPCTMSGAAAGALASRHVRHRAPTAISVPALVEAQAAVPTD